MIFKKRFSRTHTVECVETSQFATYLRSFPALLYGVYERAGTFSYLIIKYIVWTHEKNSQNDDTKKKGVLNIFIAHTLSHTHTHNICCVFFCKCTQNVWEPVTRAPYLFKFLKQVANLVNQPKIKMFTVCPVDSEHIYIYIYSEEPPEKRTKRNIYIYR